MTALCRSGAQLQIEQAGVARRGIDGVVEIELLGRTLARETPQLAQRQLQIAGTQLDRVVEVAELTLLPHLDRSPLTARTADADALGVVAAVPERRGARGADPFAATLMPLLLLRQPLAQCLEQLLPAAERLDAPLFLVAEQALRHCCQPLRRQLRLERREAALGPGEVLGEHTVEAIEMALVLDQRQARQVVEILGREKGHALPQPLQQHQQLGQRDRNTRGAQRQEEFNEHDDAGMRAARTA